MLACFLYFIDRISHFLQTLDNGVEDLSAVITFQLFYTYSASIVLSFIDLIFILLHASFIRGTCLGVPCIVSLYS